MDFDIINKRDQDMGRGVVLILGSALMVLLQFIIPAVAPLVMVAYGVYRLFTKNYGESAIAILLAILFWFLRAPISWIFWMFGAGMAGVGLFFIIRGIRGQYITE